MENLAVTYRPTCFADVVGQDDAVSVLKKIAKADGVVARSIVVQGAWGSGKTTLARIFAKALSCKNFKKTGDVCNECEGCKNASSFNSTSYLEVDSATAGNVDFIRALREKLQYNPFGRRLVVFDECHAISKQAQNALLKMLEDGVPDTIFLFATTESILPTIRSRSVELHINTIPFNLIMQRLQFIADREAIEVDQEQLEALALKSNGHMRDAISALQLFALSGEVHSSYKLVAKFLVKVLSKKEAEATECLKLLLKEPYLDVRQSLFRVIEHIFVDESGVFSKIRKAGLSMPVFQFFLSDVIQNALSKEYTFNLALEAFLNKFCNGSSSN